jgi:sarcosine oxidase delta subunit
MMIIECPYCESKVDGLVKGEHESYDPNEDPGPFKVVLLQCPVCNNALFGGTELIQVGNNKYEWSSLNRLWPEQESYVDRGIPEIARKRLLGSGLNS